MTSHKFVCCCCIPSKMLVIDNTKKYLEINMIQLMMQIDPSSDTMTDANLKIFNDFNTLKTSYDNMATVLKYVDESN